ncbi:MAG: type I restriction enzyme HsdR N-terminal domain-containing protein [Crocinitomicaceae bacterium]|nr:type I restriction enzyme HsdR N-terminal domain-containing protein [Crocinitomicaceae bacterium]
MIESLNLPKANLKLTRKDNQIYVWCTVRKKNLVCTPEEWVRQHIIHFLIQQKGIPEGLIASEFQLEYNGRSKRADIVVFDRNQQPILVVECKAPEVNLTETVFHQIANYNHELRVEYLMMTNGNQHIYCHVNQTSGEISYLEELPALFSE